MDKDTQRGDGRDARFNVHAIQRNDGYDTYRIGKNLYISLDTGTYLPRLSKTQVDYTWLLLTSCAKRASQHFDEHKK